MIKISEIGKFFVTLGSKFDSEGFDKARDNLNKVALGAVAAGAALAAVALKAAQAAGVQEQAELKLTTALKTANNTTGVTIETLKTYAANLQKITTVGDETTLQVMQLGLTMGISADKIENATTGTVGLSKAFGIDLNSSMKMVALAYQGQYEMLSRYIPELRTATSQTEKADVLNRAMANGFDLAKAEAETYLGQVEQLKNRLGDLFEVIGKMVIPVILDLVNFITNNILPAFEGWTNDVEKSGKATDIFKNILRGTISVVMGAFDAFNLAGRAITIFFLAMTGNWKAAKIGIDEIKDSVVKMGNRINAVYKDEAYEFDAKEKAKVASYIQANELMVANDIMTKEQKLELKRIEEEELKKIEDEKLKQEQERSALRESWANRFASVMSTSLSNILHAETTTWASIAKAYGQAVKQMIGYLIQQLAAEKVAKLAIAIMNAKITWGAASYQIAAVIATSTAAMVALKGLMSFDKGGIIPGIRGTPQLVLAHAGETILPTHKGGGGFGNIIVNVPPISTRAEARRMGEIVGNEIYRKIKTGRKV